MSTGIDGLRELITEGATCLGRKNSAIVSPFSSEHDETGRVVAVTWHPLRPVDVSTAELEALGELSRAPRMPDTGDLVFVIYHPTARTLLRVHETESADDLWTVESATYTTL